MKYKLLNETNKSYSAIQQILYNRRIKEEDMFHYLNTTDEDINEPELLGEKGMAAAASILLNSIKENKRAIIAVDSDCDRVYEFRTFY